MADQLRQTTCGGYTANGLCQENELQLREDAAVAFLERSRWISSGMITAASSRFDPYRYGQPCCLTCGKDTNHVGTVGRTLAGEQIGFKHKLHAAAADAAYKQRTRYGGMKRPIRREPHLPQITF